MRRPLSIPATLRICVALRQLSDWRFMAAISPTVISMTGILE